MILKDDELMIIGVIKESKIEGSIYLKDVRSIFQKTMQVGPMYRTFLQELERMGQIESFRKLTDPDNVCLPYSTICQVLNSVEYHRDVPSFMNGRGTRDNILLIITCFVLTYYNYLSQDEIRSAVEAYTLECRQAGGIGDEKCDYLELSFPIVSRALRLMGKAMSEIIFDAWVKRMEPFLLCYDRNRLEQQHEMKKREEQMDWYKQKSWIAANTVCDDQNETSQTVDSRNAAQKMKSTTSLKNRNQAGILSRKSQIPIKNSSDSGRERGSNKLLKKQFCQQQKMTTISVCTNFEIQAESSRLQDLKNTSSLSSIKRQVHFKSQAGGNSAKTKSQSVDKAKQGAPTAYLFYHEFLYLCCNAQSRIEQIIKNHKMNLKSKHLYYIHQFELDKTYYQQVGNAMTHIHLLDGDFRTDKRPAKLIADALNLTAEGCRWKYQGAQPEEKGQQTDYSMRDIFEGDFNRRIEQHEQVFPGKEATDCFVYENRKKLNGIEQGFDSELKTFQKLNYNKSEFEVNFKELDRIKKEKERREQEAEILKQNWLQSGTPTSDRYKRGMTMTRSQEESRGLYRTGIDKEQKQGGEDDIFDVSKSGRYDIETIKKLQERFDPKNLQVAPGQYDFTRAYGYDEDLVRHNLNHVVRPTTAQVVAPPLVKPKVKVEKPNFVKKNMGAISVGEVSHINLRRAKEVQLKATQESMRKKSIVNRSTCTNEIEIKVPAKSTTTTVMQSPRLNGSQIAMGMANPRQIFSKAKIKLSKLIYPEYSGGSVAPAMQSPISSRFKELEALNELNTESKPSTSANSTYRGQQIQVTNSINKNFHANPGRNQIKKRHDQVSQTQKMPVERVGKNAMQRFTGLVDTVSGSVELAKSPSRARKLQRPKTVMGKNLLVELSAIKNEHRQNAATTDRLTELAQRNNTYIDNPYQSSQIQNNFTRLPLPINALDNSNNKVSASQKVFKFSMANLSVQNVESPEQESGAFKTLMTEMSDGDDGDVGVAPLAASLLMKRGSVSQKKSTFVKRHMDELAKVEAEDEIITADQTKNLLDNSSLAALRNLKKIIKLKSTQKTTAGIDDTKTHLSDERQLRLENSASKEERDGERRRSFIVFRDTDNTQSGLIQFLGKVGSIHDLSKRQMHLQSSRDTAVESNNNVPVEAAQSYLSSTPVQKRATHTSLRSRLMMGESCGDGEVRGKAGIMGQQSSYSNRQHPRQQRRATYKNWMGKNQSKQNTLTATATPMYHPMTPAPSSNPRNCHYTNSQPYLKVTSFSNNTQTNTLQATTSSMVTLKKTNSLTVNVRKKTKAQLSRVVTSNQYSTLAQQPKSGIMSQLQKADTFFRKRQ